MNARHRRAGAALIAGALALASLAGCSRFQNERASLSHTEVAIEADLVMVDP